MSNDSPAVARRHEFVLYFDVKDGNPNGDPDAGNMPRLDPETNEGLVSDVALKRKIRNYVATKVAMGELAPEGNEIYMSEGAVLNRLHHQAWTAQEITPDKEKDFSKLPKQEGRARRLTAWMCMNFFDIRTFGAVMTTEYNAGQVRGPVQFTFARSVEQILPLEISITRSSVTNEKDIDKERTMGRKHIVPYGLYRAHGYVSAPLASHPAKGTGFSEADLELLWQALGNAQAQSLFGRVTTHRVHQGASYLIGSDAYYKHTDNWPPARRWEDYRVDTDREGLPPGIEIIER